MALSIGRREFVAAGLGAAASSALPAFAASQDLAMVMAKRFHPLPSQMPSTASAYSWIGLRKRLSLANL
jgi:hypothetical protein